MIEQYTPVILSLAANAQGEVAQEATKSPSVTQIVVSIVCVICIAVVVEIIKSRN